MEKIRVSFANDFITRTEIFISGKDIGKIFTTADAHRGIGADYGAAKYQAPIAEELRIYDCLSEAGFIEKAKAYKKDGDPRLHWRKITSKKPIPGMCLDCRKNTFCHILFSAQDMARVKK